MNSKVCVHARPVSQPVLGADELDFAAWCAELDRIAAAEGRGESIVTETGAESWADYFADGYSPQDALWEDDSNA